MRALFTCSLGLGHLHPLVPIARAMEGAGQQVAFAAPARLLPSVERSGFRAFPAGMSKTASEAFPELRGLRGHDETVLVSGRIRPAQRL